MMKFIAFGLILFSAVAFSQVTGDSEPKKLAKKDKDLPRGNAKYSEKKFAEAEADYRISASKNPDKMTSLFNLGNSIYQQKQIAESKRQYEKVIALGQSHFEKHRAYHNLGNIYMAEKKYPQAVEAYKNALKHGPDDDQTRYNYALAKKFLKNNPPPPPNKDNPQQKQQQPQKQQQQENKPEPEKGEPEENKSGQKPEPKEGEAPQKPQPKPGGISKQRLESLLKAVDNEERKVQDKVNKKRETAPPAQTDKDW